MSEEKIVKKKENRVRVLTIISSVISILDGILLILLAWYVFSNGINSVDPLALFASFGIIGLVYLLLGCAIAVAGLVVIGLGIAQIRLGLVNDRMYKRRRGSVIFYCVMDIIIAIIYAFVAVRSAKYGDMMLIFAGAMLVSFLFKVIDLRIFAHRAKSGKLDIGEQQVDFSKINLGALNPTFNMETELNKLLELKNNGSIKEDEYEVMRKQIVDKYATTSTSKKKKDNKETTDTIVVESSNDAEIVTKKCDHCGAEVTMDKSPKLCDHCGKFITK